MFRGLYCIDHTNVKNMDAKRNITGRMNLKDILRELTKNV